MKVLSLTQPFATLVAIGAKTFETRSWSTSYRGPIAIHASKGFPKWAQEECEEYEFRRALDRHGYAVATLPRGVIIATATLAGIGPTLSVLGSEVQAGSDEWLFGDYGPGRFAWKLTDVRALERPIPASGSLGLWDYPLEEVLA